MRSLVQGNRTVDPQLLQLAIQVPQSSLGVVPAPTLMDRDIHIFWTEIFHQVHHSVIPVAAQDPLVVPVNARDEDPLAMHFRHGRPAGLGMLSTDQDYGEQIDEEDTGEKEGDCAYDS